VGTLLLTQPKASTSASSSFSTPLFCSLVNLCDQDYTNTAALASSMDCCTRPKKPSFANSPSALGCTKVVLTADPPSALGCVAKAALTEFPSSLVEGRCSSRAGANNVPEEPDVAIVAAFLTFTGSPFLTLKNYVLIH
jgi:hypothetical protein